MNRCEQPPEVSSSVLRHSPRAVTREDVEQIRALIVRHPDWGRQALSVHLCQLWDWRRADGTLNHRACRHLLKRLFGLGEISLPPQRRAATFTRPHREALSIPWLPPEIADANLNEVIVRPVRFDERPRYKQLMDAFHYLGFNRVVGESIWYLATKINGSPCLFGLRLPSRVAIGKPGSVGTPLAKRAAYT